MGHVNKNLLIFIGILLLIGLVDAVRYLKPADDNKQAIQAAYTFSVNDGNEIILVYNAYGGIYPGIVDFINKEFFPSSYPCNLCYLTFGTFKMKPSWKEFINALPYTITELHKDNFKRRFTPANFPLPAILLSNGATVQVLLSAQQINQAKTLPQLKQMVQNSLAH